MAENEIKILGEVIKISNDYLPIDELRFMKDNPRVYSCIHGEPDFDNLPEVVQQERIFENLKKEPSVKNLKSEIKRHGGLMEQILVRFDTKQVIEGNSRLAVYRILHEETKDENWELIPCNIVSSLTDDQQIAFLNQIHVKGKTKWSAYEKANFAYVQKERLTFEKIADLFGESKMTISTRIKVIETMRTSGDTDRSHFSYYDVLVRNGDISKEIKKNKDLRKVLFERIRNLGDVEDPEESLDFTALELRKKLPVIIQKPKVLKKYIQGDPPLDLDTAYQSAKISNAQQKVRESTAILDGIERKDIISLDRNDLNALDQDLRKLVRTTDRINKIMEKTNEREK